MKLTWRGGADFSTVSYSTPPYRIRALPTDHASRKLCVVCGIEAVLTQRAGARFYRCPDPLCGFVWSAE